MKIHDKIISVLSLFTNFQLKFYRVRILYLCRNCKKNNDDVTRLVMHRVFNTNL